MGARQPERVETERLVLRRPRADDAEAIFERYASDPEVTRYLLSRDAWGRGYATEALRTMVELARDAGVLRLYALCHTAHAASARVLDKAGFAREGTLRRYFVFPNLSPGEPLDVLCYARVLG